MLFLELTTPVGGLAAGVKIWPFSMCDDYWLCVIRAFFPPIRPSKSSLYSCKSAVVGEHSSGRHYDDGHDMYVPPQFLQTQRSDLKIGSFLSLA